MRKDENAQQALLTGFQHDPIRQNENDRIDKPYPLVLESIE